MNRLLKALVAVSLLPLAAHAATGDLLLGFRIGTADPAANPTGANDIFLSVNLGNISQFTGASGYFATGGYSLDMSSFLTTAYGANWNSNANLTFSILGTQSTSAGIGNAPVGTHQVYLGARAAAAGTSAEFANLTSSVTTGSPARQIATPIRNVYNSYGALLTEYAADSSVVYAPGVLAITSARLAADNSAYQTTGYWVDGSDRIGRDYGDAANRAVALYDSVLGQTVTGAQNMLDLRELRNGEAFSTNLGSFVLSSNGMLTAVPEPSTYGLIGAGALAGVAAVRRRRKAIAA